MGAVPFWTLIIAVTGLVLASLTFAWTVYRDLLDRHKVSITVGKYKIASLAPSDVFKDAWNEEEECVVITATNVGRRPVTVTGFYFREAGKGRTEGIILYDPTDPRSRVFDRMPKELEEGQMARAFVPAKDLDTGQVEQFFVVDTVGRRWRSRSFPLASVQH